MKSNQRNIMRVLIPISLLLFVFTAEISSHNIDNDLFPGKTIRINPEYKINRLSNGKITVTSLNTATPVKHEFTDIYADVLFAAYKRQSMNNVTENLRKKYYLSKDECRREIKHAINVLADWKIILLEDHVAAKR